MECVRCAKRECLRSALRGVLPTLQPVYEVPLEENVKVILAKFDTGYLVHCSDRDRETVEIAGQPMTATAVQYSENQRIR